MVSVLWEGKILSDYSSACVTFPELQSLLLCYVLQLHCSVNSCSDQTATGILGSKNILFISNLAASKVGVFWKRVGFKPGW